MAPTRGRSSAQPATPAAAGAAPRDLRPQIYAGLNFSFAALYLVLFTVIIPNRHGWASALLYALPLVAAVMGGAMLVRNRWGWRTAAVACGVLLALAVVLLVLVLSSAAFLAGVYGSFGRAASAIALVIAALVVELVALVPLLQLKYLMTRAGRRCFGLAPLW